jgi:PAS domain S-box-containing protein
MTTPSDLPTFDFSEAIEDLPAPAYVIDREGRYRWLNRAYRELLGDRLGQPFIDYVVPEDRQLSRTNFARKIVGKATTVFDVTAFDRSGGRVTLRVTSAPLRRDDEVIGVFGILMPVAQATSPQESSVLQDLTPRQQEVLKLLMQGLDTQEIARRLGVADETARNHIRALLRAMGAHSRLEAVLMGLRLGLDGPNPGHEPPVDE